MSITPTDIELLASLRSDPAYMLLLDKVKALVDDLTDRLHSADSETNKELFPYWKALRTIYIELRETPEQFANLIPDKEDMELEIQPAINNKLKDFYFKLQRVKNEQEEAIVNNPPITSNQGFKNLI